MATIKLYKSKINNMPNTLSDLRSKIDSYKFDLKALSLKLLAVNNPILDKVISEISTASKIQEEQLNSLNAMQNKIDDFVETAQRIDNSVAEYIRGLRNFDVPSYGYMRFIYKGIKLPTLREYLISVLGKGDFISLYVRKKVEKMSQEEFDKYIDQLLNIDAPTDEEKELIKNVLSHYPGIEITENMSDEQLKKLEKFVKLYEKSHEDEADEIAKFFDNSNKQNGWTENEKLAIRYLAYTSDSPQHELFFRYIGKCVVTEFDALYKGNPRSYYDPNDLLIHLNRNTWSKRSPYHSVFEEIGHNIDDLMDGNNDGELESIIGKYSTKLDDALKSDVSNYIWGEINSYNDKTWFDIDGPGKQKLHDVFMGEARYAKLNPRLKTAYNNIYSSTFGVDNPEDAWNSPFCFTTVYYTYIQGYGYKESKIKQTTAYDAFSSQIPQTYNNGHDWAGEYSANLDKTEVFSQYMANGICNKKLYQMDRELLPESYRVMDEWVENVLRKKP